MLPERRGLLLALIVLSSSAAALAATAPEPAPNTYVPAPSTVFVPVIATAVTAPAASTGPPPAPVGPPTPASLNAPAVAHPMAATAPALPPSPVPAAASTPAPAAASQAVPARLDYSYIEATTLQTQPYGHTDIGHGQRLVLSYALSDQAFLVAQGARRNLAARNTHTYDLGFGLNTAKTPGHSFFAEFLWNGYSVDELTHPDNSGHGWAVAVGVRALPVSKIELYSTLRYTQNRADPGHLSGEAGFFYQFFRVVALGFSVAANPVENDYLLTLRWYY